MIDYFMTDSYITQPIQAGFVTIAVWRMTLSFYHILSKTADLTVMRYDKIRRWRQHLLDWIGPSWVVASPVASVVMMIVDSKTAAIGFVATMVMWVVTDVIALIVDYSAWRGRRRVGGE